MPAVGEGFLDQLELGDRFSDHQLVEHEHGKTLARIQSLEISAALIAAREAQGDEVEVDPLETEPASYPARAT